MNKEELEKSLIAFTDGSSLGNPGPGGWGAVLISPRMKEIIELGGMKPKTTNNQLAVLSKCLRCAYRQFGVEIVNFPEIKLSKKLSRGLAEEKIYYSIENKILETLTSKKMSKPR